MAVLHCYYEKSVTHNETAILLPLSKNVKRCIRSHTFCNVWIWCDFGCGVHLLNGIERRGLGLGVFLPVFLLETQGAEVARNDFYQTNQINRLKLHSHPCTGNLQIGLGSAIYKETSISTELGFTSIISYMWLIPCPGTSMNWDPICESCVLTCLKADEMVYLQPALSLSHLWKASCCFTPERNRTRNSLTEICI